MKYQFFKTFNTYGIVVELVYRITNTNALELHRKYYVFDWLNKELYGEYK